MAASAVEGKLKMAMLKRVKKLKKLRRRMRLWGAAGACCAVMAVGPILYYLLTGQMPPMSVEGAMYFSSDWTLILGAIIVGLFGSMIFYTQYKRDKDKYDKLRVGAIALLQSGDPVCECRWTPCTCKDDLIREMTESYDINLSY